MEKIPIFNQNHGLLNPFEKIRIFYTFLKRNYSVKESLLFYLEYQQTIFLGLFCPKTNYGKNSNFWPKPWTNPFAKIPIFSTFLKRHFCVQESLLFYLEYQQTIFVGLFCPKTKHGKNSNFPPKPLCKNSNYFHFFEKKFFC